MNRTTFLLKQEKKSVKRRRQNVVPVVSPGEATFAAFAARSPLPKGIELREDLRGPY